MSLAAVSGVQRTGPTRLLADQFRRRAYEAISTLSGPEAVEEIMRLYTADTGALDAKLADLQVEATTAAQDARSRYDMLQHAHASASTGLLHQARQAAEISALRGMVEHIEHMVNRAENGTLPAANLLGALSVAPPAPVYVPTVTGFSASDRFRAGLFVTAGEDVRFTFPFLGYALVDHGPGAAGIIETMFLVDNRTLSQSMIENERPVRLKRMLPSAELSAA